MKKLLMIMEPGLSDDDVALWVVVLGFDFDLIFMVCSVFWISVRGVVLFLFRADVFAFLLCN